MGGNEHKKSRIHPLIDNPYDDILFGEDFDLFGEDFDGYEDTQYDNIGLDGLVFAQKRKKTSPIQELFTNNQWRVIPIEGGLVGYFYPANNTNHAQSIVYNLKKYARKQIALNKDDISRSGGNVVVKYSINQLIDPLQALAIECGIDNFILPEGKEDDLQLFEEGIQIKRPVSISPKFFNRIFITNKDQWHMLPPEEGFGYFYSADNFKQADYITSNLNKIALNKDNIRQLASNVVVKFNPEKPDDTLQDLTIVCGIDNFIPPEGKADDLQLFEKGMQKKYLKKMKKQGNNTEDLYFPDFSPEFNYEEDKGVDIKKIQRTIGSLFTNNQWRVRPIEKGLGGYFYSANSFSQASSIVYTLKQIAFNKDDIRQSGGNVIVQSSPNKPNPLQALAIECGVNDFLIPAAQPDDFQLFNEGKQKKRPVSEKFFNKIFITNNQWHVLPAGLGEGYFYSANSFDNADNISCSLKNTNVLEKNNIFQSGGNVVVKFNPNQFNDPLQALAIEYGVYDFILPIADTENDLILFNMGKEIKQSVRKIDPGKTYSKFNYQNSSSIQSDSSQNNLAAPNNYQKVSRGKSIKPADMLSDCNVSSSSGNTKRSHAVKVSTKPSKRLRVGGLDSHIQQVALSRSSTTSSQSL